MSHEGWEGLGTGGAAAPPRYRGDTEEISRHEFIGVWTYCKLWIYWFTSQLLGLHRLINNHEQLTLELPYIPVFMLTHCFINKYDNTLLFLNPLPWQSMSAYGPGYLNLDVTRILS